MSIILKNVIKSFENKQIFNINELTIHKGFNILYGPSGCGKTTLGKMIAGIEKFDSGIISGSEGKSTLLFQQSLLLPTLSARDNVFIVCKKKAYKDLGIELLNKLDILDDDLNKLPSELSGGMARRVEIVRAILFAVESGGNFVLLDEPFTGLDESSKVKATGIIKEYLFDKIVLIISHDIGDKELLSGNEINFSILQNE